MAVHPPNETRTSGLRAILDSQTQIDSELPQWVRRSNPVIRRELGSDWKGLFPNLGLLGRVLLVEMAVMLIFPLKVILIVILPLALLFVFLLPSVIFLYFRALIKIIYRSSTAMIRAKNQHTLDLLRVSLVPLTQIIRGKVAASLWSAIGDLDFVLLGVVAFVVPYLSVRYLAMLETDAFTWGIRARMVLEMLSWCVRIFTEPFMFASLGVLLGTWLKVRSTPVMATLSAMVFYYGVLVALQWVIGVSGGWHVAVVLIPMVLPPVVGWVALRATHEIITSQA